MIMIAVDANVTALVLVVRASVAEMRSVSKALARSPKQALSRLVDEAGVLSSALQRLDKALEEMPASAGPEAQRQREKPSLRTPEQKAADPEAGAKLILALDRMRRWSAPGGRCPRCGSVR